MLFVHFDTSTVVSVCNCIQVHVDNSGQSTCKKLTAHFLTNYFSRARIALIEENFASALRWNFSLNGRTSKKCVFVGAPTFIYSTWTAELKGCLLFIPHGVRGSGEGVFVCPLFYNTPRWGWFQALKIMLQRGKILLHNCRASKYWYKMLGRACTTRRAAREPLLGALNYVAHEDTHIW